MKYPSWAPKSLVDEANKMRDSDSIYRLAPKLFIAQKNEILNRLLTRTEMKAAWKTIYTTPIVEGLHKSLAMEDNADALWWGGLLPGLEQFEKAPKRTTSENKKSLLKIAKLARDLATALRSDPVASKKVQFFIQNQVGKLRNDFCQDGFGEPVPWHDQSFPAMAIWSDADDAISLLRRGLLNEVALDEESEILLQKGDGSFWSALPEAERFAYWTRELSELNLVHLLRNLSFELKVIPEPLVPISQPGRMDSGRLPFMVRWMSGFMHARYGKPLDETVGIVVGVALDLPEILTRESVRAYIKNTPGKKTSSKTRKSPRPK